MGPDLRNALRGPESRAVLVKLAELALTTYSGNGMGPPADVLAVLAAIAAGSPETAARCPRLLAVLPRDVRAGLLRDAGVPGITGALTVAEAAATLGISRHGVRARCRRGQLVAAKHKISGEWRIDGTDLG